MKNRGLYIKVNSELFHPPPKALRVAGDRTYDILVGYGLMAGEYTMKQLAASCYLQGVADCAEAMARAGRTAVEQEWFDRNELERWT